MMATNNTEACKKQKITEAVDNGGNLSLPAVGLVDQPALSFGNILKEFPDFLFCVLTYISDRVIWNSIASSNKDMYGKSKTILPPWPLWYKLPYDDSYSIITWSPCGTRIVCRHDYSNIVIVDQRRGPLRNNRHINAHGGSVINDLKYSPSGRFIVSTGSDSFVRLWDNVTGVYEEVQEWNIQEEVAEELIDVPRFCISACSKYIAVSLGTYIFLKDVDGGKTIKSLMAPFDDEKIITKTVFSSNGRTIFICCREQNNGVVIKVWHPYLDDDDEDRLIILGTETFPNRGVQTVAFSRDNSMVVIHNEWTNKGVLLSIDTDHKCLTKEFDFQGSTGLYFTPDGNYIVCNTTNGPTFWSITEGRFTNDTIHILDIGDNTKRNFYIGCFSPNNRQLIIQELGDHYITSYVVK